MNTILMGFGNIIILISFYIKINWTDIIAVIIAVIALYFSFWSFRNQRKRDINDKWADLARLRIDLWATLTNAHTLWQCPYKPAFDNMILAASVPDTIMKGKNIRGFTDDIKDNIKSNNIRDKEILFQFCQYVYHSSSITSPLHGSQLYKSISELTWYLNGWYSSGLHLNKWPIILRRRHFPFTFRRYLFNRFRTDYLLFIILTWWELVLKDDIGLRWSERTQFFEFAYRIARNPKIY